MIRINKLLVRLMLCLPLGGMPVHGQTQMVFGPGPEGATSTLDAIVAVVNDDVVTRRELNAATAQIERQLQQKKVPMPPRPILESQVLERLILSQLELRAAERVGITVDDATLNAAIDNLARRNNMNLTQMRQNVEKDGMSFARFRDDVRRELIAARLRQKVVDSQIQISEQDVDSLRSQIGSPNAERPGGNDPGTGGSSGGRQYHIAQILVAVPEGASPDQIATIKRQADNVLARLRKGEDFQQLAAGVSAGQQALEGGDLGWRDAEQLPTIFTNVVPKLQPGQFSELVRSPSGFHIVKLLEVRGGGSRNVTSRPASQPLAGVVNQTRARHILLKTSPELPDDEAHRRLEQLRQRIEAGEDFAALARAHSDDKGSGARGGELGWVSPGMLVPEFEQELGNLQANQMSAPFKTQFGWHIVQVLERRQGQASPETERARVREALFRRRSDEEWELWLRRLRDEAYVEIRLPRPMESTAVDVKP
ncbi:MAG: peptidyl-prolyl cis-trans isomerase SurA [Pseudomonadota bacterium]|nr:peptidyl-prolyl cis-trans isomerase SurA [Pseudomonadota bacterium]